MFCEMERQTSFTISHTSDALWSCNGKANLAECSAGQCLSAKWNDKPFPV